MTTHNATPSPESDSVIDTSSMSDGKRHAMEVAESARQAEPTEPSFARELFLGSFRPDLVLPFPAQSAQDAAVGDAFMAELFPYLEKQLDPEQVDATRTIPQEVIDRMFAMGVFAMKVPEKYGGLGFSQVNYNRVMMRLASYCGSTAVLVSAHQSIGVPQPLKMFGTEEQKKRYFPRFRKDAISAFALTEPGVGSDPAQMSTEAKRSADGTHFILNGEKLWCTNGPIADVMVVMARTASKIVNGKERKQITAFIVEGEWPGVEVAHRCDFMGIRGIQNGLLRFRDVRVPAENMLGEEGKGLKLALATLNTGRLTLPAACTGAAKQCLAIARRWGNQRVQWGLPVGQHEAGRDKIARMAATTFAMEAVTWLTSHWADLGTRDIRLEAAMAKMFCSEAAWRIVDDTMQLRGGRGYETATSLKGRGEVGYPVERMMREIRINMIIEGTSEIMRLFLAREALDPHLRIAADLLKRGTPAGRKAVAGLRVLGHYAAWYPAQWVNASLWARHGSAGPLAGHFRYIDRAAHRLARSLFHGMVRHQARLDSRQNLLGRLMEIGTELFAMAAACSYARGLAQRTPERANAIALADAFCAQARLRIEDRFRAVGRNADRNNNKLARQVLAGDLRWLEDNIVWMGPME